MKQISSSKDSSDNSSKVGKEEHIETLQDRTTEVLDEKSLCQYKQNS